MPRPKLVPIQTAKPEFKIERGIPIPRPKTGLTGGAPKYPFAEMQVGDSLFFTGRKQSSISAGALYVGKKLGRKYTTRKMDGGVRIWRIA